MASTGRPPPRAPTPIYISRRTRNMLAATAFIAFAVLLWQVPSLLGFALGGAALAIVLSFPARLLSRVMPRWLAILISFVLLGVLAITAFIGVLPILLDQLGALTNAIPAIAERIDRQLPRLLERSGAAGVMPLPVNEFVENAKGELLEFIQNLAHRFLGAILPFVAGAVGAAATLFGIVFIAAYLLADARKLYQMVLHASPHRYRRDVRALWNAFSFTLSRYLGGLAISLSVQGAVSAAALYVLGVPYVFLLGAWVALTALIPYLGAWLGAVPAVLLALSISLQTAVLTGILFLLIQLAESNLLTPQLQGKALDVHPVLVFLAVVLGANLAGLAGIIFAVPVLAVLHVLLEFFRARIHVTA
ncbi:AI-2E family transporter [Massilia sp.]|uniref:AI-2E family transporter n=1 Tax=Massilia sp. TaxID=1882437 RepID=UPI00391C790D